MSNLDRYFISLFLVASTSDKSFWIIYVGGSTLGILWIITHKLTGWYAKGKKL